MRSKQQEIHGAHTPKNNRLGLYPWTLSCTLLALSHFPGSLHRCIILSGGASEWLSLDQGQTLVQLLESLAESSLPPRRTQRRMPFLFLPNPHRPQQLPRSTCTDLPHARSTEILKTSKPRMKTASEGSKIEANQHASSGDGSALMIQTALEAFFLGASVNSLVKRSPLLRRA